ncbi:hypothetical protein PI124_g23212 [Phytophthora idaei]|nr:hypothetical protein PI124_g23212 [Phytophthora idaei]
MQLLTMGFFSIGTVRSDRQGLSHQLLPKKKKGDKKQPPPPGFRRTDPPTLNEERSRCQSLCAYPNATPPLVGYQSGAHAQHRRQSKDGQTYMGGVDAHDQLRLQRYSLQLCMKYKKYYKGLFMGLVDLAIINAYIVYNAARVTTNKLKMGHVKFLKQLHLELCQLRRKTWRHCGAMRVSRRHRQRHLNVLGAAGPHTHSNRTMNEELVATI